MFMRDEAKRILSQSVVIEGELGFEPEIDAPNKWETVEEYHKAGFKLLNIAVATDMTSMERGINYLSEIKLYINSNSNKYYLYKNYNDLNKPENQKKLGLLLSFQGMGPIGKNIELVDIFFELGVQMMALIYNVRNHFGDGCVEPNNAGLSLLGRKLVKKMNDVGMIIDLSHAGEKTALEAIELSSSPVIFSHSNVSAIFKHPRNLSNDVLKKVAQTGGIIGLNSNSLLLGESKNHLEKYFEHLDHITQLVGPDHVALGSDIVYFPELFPQFIQKNPAVYPSKGYFSQTVPGTFNNEYLGPQKLIEIIELCLKKGYSELNIKKFIGENYVRILNRNREKSST